MQILHDVDISLMLTLLTLLITGYLLYKLITCPIKSFKFVFKATFILLLGCAVWLGVLCFLMYV